MGRKSKYKNDIQIYASKRYSDIKQRVKYDLDDFWTRESFISWYEDEPKVCCYCQCTTEELKLFYDLNDSKRKTTRGRVLEIERKNDAPYSQDNCKLSCYWCNNAKSDVFTFEEFKQIGKSIGTVIKHKIKGYK